MLFNFLTNVADAPKDTEKTTIHNISYDTLEWYWCLLIILGVILLIVGIRFIIKWIAKK